MEQNSKTPFSLSQEDVDSIHHVTRVSDVIPTEVRERASVDIIKTLENNHPLNKIWRDGEGKIIGYLGFEDFSPGEAYAKYLATEGLNTENPFSVIPDLIEEAKRLSYTKIHFHGFNQRLNKVLTHFGFQKTRTDESGGYTADHYEIRLEPSKPAEVQQKTREAFEQKYTSHLIQEIEKTANTLSEERKEKLSSAESDILQKLSSQTDFDLSEKRKLILKLKLARYLQRHDDVDTNTLFDAIIESPKWLDKDKGGFDGLLEVHEQKTLLKIAEMRRKKAEQTGKESFNPYEALFETASGKYYLARLLNMPHLEEESQYMKHCVGTSDSYISKMKKGEAEILSIRDTKNHEPILTIEYFPKSHLINQIKGPSDKYLTGEEDYFSDVLEILKRMKESQTDAGESRKVAEINPSELGNFEVKDYYILTENGEVSFRDFIPDDSVFVLKMGEMPITSDISKEDQAKIIKILAGVVVAPIEISNSVDELTEKTAFYIGPWNPTTYEKIRQYPNIKHIYEKFPHKKAFFKEIAPDPEIASAETAIAKLEAEGHTVPDYPRDMLTKVNWQEKLRSSYEVVSFSLAALFGDQNSHTYAEIKAKAAELGLGLVPQALAPSIRLNYDKNGELTRIAMEAIRARDGSPLLFSCRRVGDESWLDFDNGRDGYEWHPGLRFFFVRK